MTVPIQAEARVTPRFRSWSATHPGARRPYNEDRLVNRPDLGLWAVADGAGGHQSGDVAADALAQALEATPAALPGGDLLAEVRARVSATHDGLRAEADRRGGGAMLASTLVTLLARDGHFACLWAGDSRAYRLRDGALAQITHDHSLVQELVDAGAIPEADAEKHPQANVITRAVGADDPELLLDKTSEPLEPGDRFLLCSDGLCKTLPHAELATLLAHPAPAEALVGAALARLATDNVTAVVVQVLP